MIQKLILFFSPFMLIVSALIFVNSVTAGLLVLISSIDSLAIFSFSSFRLRVGAGVGFWIVVYQVLYFTDFN